MNARRLAWCACVVAVARPAAAWADGGWLVTTADFRTQAADVRGVTADAVRLAAADGSTRDLPLTQFVSAQRVGVAPPPPPRFTLVLAGGDRLVGEPAGVTGETMAWAEPVLGRVPVGLGRMVAIGKGSTAVAADERPKQDVVTLANGDTVAGVLTGGDGAKLTVQSADGTPVDVPLANVARVAFANAGGGAVPKGAFRVRLADGSALTAAGLTVDGSRATITPVVKGAKAVTADLSAVVALEQLDGPVAWLSRRTPTESVQVPYVGGSAAWPARFDAAVDGGPLTVDGRAYDHGIGVHAYSRLSFAVDPAFTGFRTQYAIDSRRGAPRLLADVTVRVKVDGRVVHEAAHVRAGAISPVVRVDLTGAKVLTLECDYGPAGDAQAHLNWLQPALLRAGATSQPVKS